MNIHGAKATVRKNNINMISAESGPRSALAYQSVRLRREKLSIREREVKQRLLVVMVAAAELRAKYGAPLTESDSEGIPASI